MVSIILPTYNGAKWISKAIESVMSQSLSDWELIVIIDGSIDNTLEITNRYAVRDSRIIVMTNDINLGLVKTLNKGISEANGEYIARIDDDDIWIDKDKLKKQIEFLNNNHDYGLVGTDFEIFSENNKLNKYFVIKITDADIRRNILSFNPFCHSSIVFRKDILKKIGQYNDKLKYTEDWDLWLRIGSVTMMRNISDVTVQYLNRNGMSKKNTKIRQIMYHLRLIFKYWFKYPNKIIALLKLLNYAIFY